MRRLRLTPFRDPFVHDSVTGRAGLKRSGRDPSRAPQAPNPQNAASSRFPCKERGKSAVCWCLRGEAPATSVLLWTPMQMLVTRASGYLGAALAPRLSRDGHAVRGFARNRARVHARFNELVIGDA